MPGIAQVVPVGVGYSDQGLDGVDVLLLHLGDAGAGCQQGEPGQGLHVGVTFQLWGGESQDGENENVEQRKRWQRRRW